MTESVKCEAVNASLERLLKELNGIVLKGFLKRNSIKVYILLLESLSSVYTKN